VPFNERGGTLRGALDLVCGRFPRFVFGGRVSGDILPVFHFHDHTRDELEPKLRYLAENGYRTVTCDEIADFAAGHSSHGGRRVAICFDDAWASVWDVAAPLLQSLGQTAIVFAIPGRIGQPDSPFVTWEQLRTLYGSGVADVQCHTFSHSRVFCGRELTGFVTPAYASVPFLNRPQLSAPPRLRFLTVGDLGAPLYPARSRMSDGARMTGGEEAHARCVELVAREGREAFFTRPDWRSRLEAIAREACLTPESDSEQERAIEDELASGRDVLNQSLRTTGVRHICLPWGVSGRRTARALKRLGFRTAFANRIPGVHAVRAGDDPLWLKRLPNKYIFALPGRGRRTWLL
jgi:peptidoglycan/xylan/chitin deacetylase (PgdA/CDA1 family)